MPKYYTSGWPDAPPREILPKYTYFQPAGCTIDQAGNFMNNKTPKKKVTISFHHV